MVTNSLKRIEIFVRFSHPCEIGITYALDVLADVLSVVIFDVVATINAAPVMTPLEFTLLSTREDSMPFC